MSLSTHVLDTAHGLPAAGLKIDLWRLGMDNKRTLVRHVETNSDGRVSSPLLNNDESEIGEYELVFYVGDYFRSKELNISDPAFLNQVPLRFGISDSESHYHVPLLVTPWGYSTYRGS